MWTKYFGKTRTPSAFVMLDIEKWSFAPPAYKTMDALWITPKTREILTLEGKEMNR